MKDPVIIIGAGLSGLTAAVTLAERGEKCVLVSRQPSERAQSVLAAGGINGALNTMGEHDTPEEHYRDTMKAGCDLADPEAVRGITEAAPEIIRWLQALGVPFQTKDGVIQQRNFGGQKKKRTAYSRGSTGKMLMTGLMDETRKYEADGKIRRLCHHDFLSLVIRDGRCAGAVIADPLTGKETVFYGTVLLCFGGMNGLFPEMTTGTTQNSGDALAQVFSQGVRLSNLEMIQYHPTTFAIAGKRCLISEAARGEGGRLFILRDGKPWFFMEEKYPELGNLMPRDVVSREMVFAGGRPDCEGQVYLDMTGLSRETWQSKLPDLRKEIMHYLGIDPAKKPVPVEPGIHYFMGGIDVDVGHRTNFPGLYAAGECCSQYHGANRLGGNSLLGAIYGGRTAARTILEDSSRITDDPEASKPASVSAEETGGIPPEADPALIEALCRLQMEALGIVRSGQQLDSALSQLDRIAEQFSGNDDPRNRNRIRMTEAMLRSALLRQESRGAHYRTDYPETDPAQCALTTAVYGKELTIAYKK